MRLLKWYVGLTKKAFRHRQGGGEELFNFRGDFLNRFAWVALTAFFLSLILATVITVADYGLPWM